MKSEEAIIYDFILENEITTQEALDVGVAVGGYSVETLNFILYSKTGMHDIEQCFKCAKNEFYFDDVVKELYDLNEE